MVAVPEAQGESFGEALRRMIGEGRKTSYTAVGWHAQIRKLADMGQRGSDAADRAGLDVTARTLKGWLAGAEPTRANQQKIHQAYQELAGARFPTSIKGRDITIKGKSPFPGDNRNRGHDGSSPLRIENAPESAWDRIEEAWNEGTLSDDQLEDYFIEDVIGDSDIGETTADFVFSGPYSVSA